MDVHTHRVRDNSPNRAKICRMQKKVKPAKKVQVVYYLSRNGLLEHPHYVEIKLLANEPLRLKDVFDRLIALRGSGMPLQYSWSCKRNYKSGYVWYDLALNDIIHCAEGAEYVLKGSELVEGCSERFQQLQVSNKQTVNQQQEAHYNYNSSKGKAFNNCSPHTHREGEEYEEFEEQEEEYEDGEKTSYTSSTTTPHSRCSRGVSTDEILVLDEDQDTTTTKLKPHALAKNKDQNKTTTTTTTTSTTSDKEETTATLAEKLNQEAQITNGRNTSSHSKRFEEESESGTRTGASRNSVLLQLIACGSGSGSGGSGVEAKNEPRRVSNVGTSNRNERREKKVICKEEGEEGDMIQYYVSENPRFGNMVSEEKEYFSGSLVDSIKANRVGSQMQPVLKKSNSYNEERRSKLGMEEEKEKVKVKGMEEEKREETKGGGVKGKCIPRKKSSKDTKKSL